VSKCLNLSIAAAAAAAAANHNDDDDDDEYLYQSLKCLVSYWVH
jgi:hypothetical protein